jgi:hypothetical protein
MALPAELVIVVVSAVGGYSGKILQARWAERRADRRDVLERWKEDRQSVFLPLLGAARDFAGRLDRLARIYRGEPEAFQPQSLSADFRELYLLDPGPIADLYAADPNEPRRDDRAVQRLRTRMCRELNFATSSLYLAARYIAEAQSAARRLHDGRHGLPEAAARDLGESLAAVAAALQGPTGAGIATEQQESIGEMMRASDGRVITQYEFRQRLLALPGWEQFTSLMTFFLTEDDDVAGRPAAARLAAKVDHEVAATAGALRTLTIGLDELTGLTDPAHYRAAGEGAAGRQRLRAATESGAP